MVESPPAAMIIRVECYDANRTRVRGFRDPRFRVEVSYSEDYDRFFRSGGSVELEQAVRAALADQAGPKRTRIDHVERRRDSRVGVDQLVLIGGALGGLGGVAQILKIIFARHSGKLVKFGPDGTPQEVVGLSAKEITHLLERTAGLPPGVSEQESTRNWLGCVVARIRGRAPGPRLNHL
ncbi:hypothetical protein NONI108955_34295 [Nocardia ninae]|uniref:Uncharacterized protein n=1 Tax=Nocardia ninae NBRC 108245 TaxID=1210091 RepID=A0A511MRZ6_9NOCA|nr:hypothetical protein [Nocardia ninae]GEM43349.1 hypothetical protein NN4_78680 [Nocardia ninae NBRC 108245]